MHPFDRLSPEDQLEHIEVLARNVLSNYDLPPGLDITMVNFSENVTYRVDAPTDGNTAGRADGRPDGRAAGRADGRKWALRVHREGYHTRNGIGSEIAWMKALREEGGVPTPIAVPGKDGELIQDGTAESVPRPRQCVLFEWLPGHEPDEEGDLAASFEELGEISARLHKHARAWTLPEGFERLIWDYDHMLGAAPNWGRWRDGMGMDAERVALFERLSATIERRLDAFGKGPERYGVIHADLRLANLLVGEGGTRVIDFDDSGFGWYMYDFGAALSFIEDRPDVPELTAAWVKGYRRVLELPEAEEAEIPTFILLRRLLLVAWIGSHSATDLAKEMGMPFTEGTVGLAEAYLARFG